MRFGLALDFGSVSPCSTAREAPRGHSLEAERPERNRGVRGVRVRWRHRARCVLGVLS